jgi:hypothetical protein
MVGVIHLLKGHVQIKTSTSNVELIVTKNKDHSDPESS